MNIVLRNEEKYLDLETEEEMNNMPESNDCDKKVINAAIQQFYG